MNLEIKDVTLDNLAVGPVTARVYCGDEYGKGAPVLLYFQGGAFQQTGIRDCPVAQCLAAIGAIVIVPDYNAPLGSAFPQSLEVGFQLFSHLAKKRAGFGDRKSLLLVGGEEAGGNVAAAISLKARDHLANELDGQLLMSPLLDPFMGSASMRKADEIGMREAWASGWSHYLSAGVCHPYAAPSMCSRLAGVASAMTVTSADDPLLDEALGYAEKLKAGGVRSSTTVLPAGVGWTSIYGGQTGQQARWQEDVSRDFNSFILHARI